MLHFPPTRIFFRLLILLPFLATAAWSQPFVPTDLFPTIGEIPASDSSPATDSSTFPASYSRGMDLIRGTNGKKDFKQGFKLLKSAYDRGYATAAYQIAILADRGFGPETSVESVVHWLMRAAMGGCPEAAFELGKINYFGYRGFPANDLQAREWFLLAAEKGHLVSQIITGYLYQAGFASGVNSKEAVGWFKKARMRNSPWAAYFLGYLGIRGLGGITPNFGKDYKELRFAADAGLSAASINLGQLFDNGLNGPSDRSTALRHYLRAARSGSPGGFAALASLAEEEGDLLRAFLFIDLAKDAMKPEARTPWKGLTDRESLTRYRFLLRKALRKRGISLEGNAIRKTLWRLAAMTLPGGNPFEAFILFDLGL